MDFSIWGLMTRRQNQEFTILYSLYFDLFILCKYDNLKLIRFGRIVGVVVVVVVGYAWILGMYAASEDYFPSRTALPDRTVWTVLDLGEGSLTIIVCNDYCNHRK